MLGSRTRVGLGVGIIGACLALMLWRFSALVEPKDAAYFLVAGKAWLAGADPYGPAFVRFAGSYIPPVKAIWSYPPQWWWIATPLAVLPDTAAFWVWRAGNVVAILVGGALTYRAVLNAGERPPLWAALLFAASLMLADVTKGALMLGQTSPLLVLGFGLMLYGLAKRLDAMTAAGIAVLLLKPQFGLIFLAVLAVYPRTRRPAAFAVVATAIACLPIVFEFGIAGTIESARGLLHNLSAYGVIAGNRPLELTGLPYLLWLVGLPPLAALGCTILAAILSVAILGRDPEPLALALVPLVACFLLVPLHIYDFTLLPVLLLAVRRFSPFGTVCMLVSIAMSWRVSSLTWGLFRHSSPALEGHLLASIIWSAVMVAASWLAAVAVIGAFSRWSEPEPDAERVASAA